MRPDRALGMLAATCAALALSGCGGGSSSGGAPRTYSVGGSISGLTQSGLVLTDNGADANTIAANATQFTMPTQVADGGNYVIAVGTQPAGETCTVIDGAGAVSGAVTSVAVDCAPWSIFTHSVLYSFAGGSDGVRPYAALIQASDGNFYGTTYGGGANSDGTVFKLTPSGSETVLHSFAGGSDGANPYAALIQASDGNFYGTTAEGGANSDGTAFRVTPSGSETVLYAFADASAPQAALIQASDGNFYGTTNATVDGSYIYGTVFKLTPSGSETVLHTFGIGDARYPLAALIQVGGNFYGTTEEGGANGYGTVFEVTPSGSETVLYSFAGGSDGANPRAALIQASDGNFYGATSDLTLDGASGGGSVFEIVPQ